MSKSGKQRLPIYAYVLEDYRSTYISERDSRIKLFCYQLYSLRDALIQQCRSPFLFDLKFNYTNKKSMEVTKSNSVRCIDKILLVAGRS